jgi:hypothetical protein
VIMMEDIVDVMDDGRIIFDMNGYVGDTCMEHLNDVVARLKSIGIKADVENAKKKNSVLAAPQGMTIRRG